jgi:hypothetical protein
MVGGRRPCDLALRPSGRHRRERSTSESRDCGANPHRGRPKPRALPSLGSSRWDVAEVVSSVEGLLPGFGYTHSQRRCRSPPHGLPPVPARTPVRRSFPRNDHLRAKARRSRSRQSYAYATGSRSPASTSPGAASRGVRHREQTPQPVGRLLIGPDTLIDVIGIRGVVARRKLHRAAVKPADLADSPDGVRYPLMRRAFQVPRDLPHVGAARYAGSPPGGTGASAEPASRRDDARGGTHPSHRRAG